MQINNAQVLQTHLAAGGLVKLDGDQLKTQSKFGAFMQRMGDAFRSSETIAARSERLTLAIAEMMRGADPTRGPQNLANAPATTPEQRAERLASAKVDITVGMAGNAVNKAFPDAPQELRQAVTRHLQGYTRHLASKGALAGDYQLGQLPLVAESVLTRLRNVNPNLLNDCKALMPVATRSPAELTEHSDFLQQRLAENCRSDRQQVKNGQRVFDDQGFYDVALKDCNRDRPAINGTRIQGDTAGALLADYRQQMTTFAPNRDEREILTYLMSQTALAPPTMMTSGVPGFPSLANTEGVSPLMVAATNSGSENRISIARNGSGDAVIHVNLDLNAGGSLDNINYNLQVGSMSYDVVVPHAQFAQPLPAGQLPVFQIQNMQIGG